MHNRRIRELAGKNVKLAIILGFLGAFLSGFVLVYTNIAAIDIGNNGAGGDEEIGLRVNTYIDDASVTVDTNQIVINTASENGVGLTIPGIEATAARPAVNNTLVIGNYSYSFIVHETSDTCANCWDDSPSDKFSVKIYGHNDTGPAVTLLTTTYFEQVTATTTGTSEGVTVTVDLGVPTAIHDHFDIIVERQ